MLVFDVHNENSQIHQGHTQQKHEWQRTESQKTVSEDQIADRMRSGSTVVQIEVRFIQMISDK